MIVFDAEFNGFNPTRIHCLSYNDNGTIKTLTNYDDMRGFLKNSKCLVGHNIQIFDLPVLERLLGVKYKGRVIDTLAISWGIYPSRINQGKKHGLESWGEEFSTPKPPIDDWETLPIEIYIERCKEDTKINSLLWDKMQKDLGLLYDNKEDSDRYINYLSYKMECVSEQEQNPIKFDLDAANKLLDRLEKLKAPKYDKLQSLMPDVPVKATRLYPAKSHKNDGNLSASGIKWQELLKEHSLPGSHKEPIEVISKYNDPNPGSPTQLKNWLFSLGWEPTYHKTNKDKKEVPQLRLADRSLCPNILALSTDVPELLELVDFLNIMRAITVLKNKKEDGGLIINQENGYIKASMGGFTNTLRLKHKTVVNLPKPSVPWGKEIRSLFICEDNEIMVGSDLSSLEDRTKIHYIYPYDPDYCKSMETPGYDPHLQFAVFAGALTEEQAQAHKDGTEDHSDIRHLYKTTNYSATYGIGAPKLSKNLKISLFEAKQLLNGYWDLNQSIKSFAADQVTKKCLGLEWVFNPVSKFWYQLRSKKDIFSTVNQSTGAYIFDLWVKEIRKQGIKIRLSMHDECMFTVEEKYNIAETVVPSEIQVLSEDRIIQFLDDKEDIWYNPTEKLLKDAIQAVNKRLCLNKEMGIDISFGNNYSEVH